MLYQKWYREFESHPHRPSTSSGLLRYIISVSWVVYILFCDQKTFYVGISDNLEKRINDHKHGYSKYTKKFSDIKLVHKEYYQTRRQAEIREQQIKGWSVAKKKALIEGNKELLIKLSKSS